MLCPLTPPLYVHAGSRDMCSAFMAKEKVPFAQIHLSSRLPFFLESAEAVVKQTLIFSLKKRVTVIVIVEKKISKVAVDVSRSASPGRRKAAYIIRAPRGRPPSSWDINGSHPLQYSLSFCVGMALLFCECSASSAHIFVSRITRETAASAACKN